MKQLRLRQGVAGESTVGNGHGMQCCEHPLSFVVGNGNRARYLSGHRPQLLATLFLFHRKRSRIILEAMLSHACPGTDLCHKSQPSSGT